MSTTVNRIIAIPFTETDLPPGVTIRDFAEITPLDEDTATEGHPFPPAPHINLGDGYTQPPLPGM